VRELVRRDDRTAVRVLTRLARRDPSPMVRAAAEQGLRELGVEGAIAEPEELLEIEEPSQESQPRLQGPEGVDYDSLPMSSLVDLLFNGNEIEREYAVDALGYNEHYAAVPDLWSAFFREPDWFIRDLILDTLDDLDQEVDEMRELLYMADEREIDWARVFDSLQ
jgi:HEAT repeat protein